MKLITIIIPTYNRPDYISKILDVIPKNYQSKLCEVIVYDSSNNSQTKEVVEKHNIESFDKVGYVEVESTVDVDSKMILAIQNVKTKFVFLSGDGTTINIKKLDELLSKSEFFYLDILDIAPIFQIGRLNQDKDCFPDSIYSYNDINEYVSKYFSHLTYLGSAIVRTELLKDSIDRNINKYLIYRPCWWLPCCFVEGLAFNGKKFGVIYTNCLGASYSNEKKRSWDNGENYIKIVFHYFNENIQQLPDIISEDTRKRMTSYFRRDCLATNRYMVGKRIDGSIKLKWVRQYKKDICYIRGYYWKMIILSLIPSKFLAFAKNCFKIIRRSSKNI